MKKVSSFIAFFLMGIGASYFFANHKIVENKNNFTEEINLLSSKYNAKEISFNELQKQNQELSGKIFQLLFTYFGIDLRAIELNSINKATELSSKESKTVEKIVYIEKESPKKEEEVLKNERQKIWNGNIQEINLSTYLQGALPINEKNKEFEILKRNYSKLQTKNKNIKMHTLEFDLDYTIKNKVYSGTYKVNYSLINKDKSTITLIGAPTIFITNYKYPGLIGIWIHSKRLVLINTMNGFKATGPRGLIFLRDKFSMFKVEATLFKKRFF